jgi:hypothetical protein
LSSKALNAEEENSKFGKAVNYLGRELLPVFKILPFINKQVSNYANNMSEATTFTEDFVRIGRLQNMNLSKETVVLKDNDKAQRSATEAKKKARQAAKEHADTLRDRVQTAYENVTEKVKDAQTQFDNFKTSLHDQVTGFVSLSDAVRTQADADSNFADALQERRQAYADLAKQDPVKDADAYAEALLNVASAENKLSAAATVRASADYSSVFSKQIEDAKKFARNLQELLGRGLGQAGLAQLLNLGPVAGYSVTEDMLSGARGISLSSFNESLASLSAAGTSLGTTGANAFFGTQLSNATSAQGQVNQYQITVNAGLVSNPAQVGRDIIEAIKSAERVSGQVFVSV